MQGVSIVPEKRLQPVSMGARILSRQVYGEPTEVLYARVPQSVRRALLTRCQRERRTISALVSIILEDWLRERGELAPREPQAAEVA